MTFIDEGFFDDNFTEEDVDEIPDATADFDLLLLAGEITTVIDPDVDDFCGDIIRTIDATGEINRLIELEGEY